MKFKKLSIKIMGEELYVKADCGIIKAIECEIENSKRISDVQVNELFNNFFKK